MGIKASAEFHSDDITAALDRLADASPGRKWKCKRDDDVAIVTEGSQTKMRILGGVTLADKDFPKTAIVTGMVDGDGESGAITIEAKPSAGVDNAGGRLAVADRWEHALAAWVVELARVMGHGD